MWVGGALTVMSPLGYLYGHTASVGVNRDWGMLGRMAYGPAGGLLFSTCVFVDLYGGIVSSLIIVRSQMNLVLPVSGVALGGIIYALFFLLLFIDARHFSFIAALGLISMLLAVACLLVTAGELDAVGEMAKDQDMLKWEGNPAGAGKEFVVDGAFDLISRGEFQNVSAEALRNSKTLNDISPAHVKGARRFRLRRSIVYRSLTDGQVWLSTPSWSTVRRHWYISSWKIVRNGPQLCC